MALDRPQEPPPKGTESGRDSLLAQVFLRPAADAQAAILGSTSMKPSATPEPCVEKNSAGATTALVFNTDSIYQQNAKKADERFEALVAA